MSNKRTFFVKEKSLIEFMLKNRIAGSLSINSEVLVFSDPARPFAKNDELVTDILLRKDALSKDVEYVVIEIGDEARESEVKLISQYSYEVKAYDDVSVVLEFIGVDTSVVVS